MKKIFIALFILNTSYLHADDASLSRWPEIPYKTEIIGQFMTFCVNQLNVMASTSQPDQWNNNRRNAIHAHTKVCGCIMDTFRLRNSEFTFKVEFEAQTKEEVPYFSKYYAQCTQINNNQQILNNGL